MSCQLQAELGVVRGRFQPMIVNQATAIIGTNVLLVPYRPEHVPTYHNWMLSAELRELTASEPLSLDEEYEMQRKWQEDSDKLTFIILARSDSENDEELRDQTPSPQQIVTFPMVGDVNLFFKDVDETDEVEVEIMIAEATYRRKGVASEALELLFHYATTPDGPVSLRIMPERFVVRIGEDNFASQRLFEKLGFVISKRVAVFREIEMRYRGSGNWQGGKTIVF